MIVFNFDYLGLSVGFRFSPLETSKIEAKNPFFLVMNQIYFFSSKFYDRNCMLNKQFPMQESKHPY